MSNFLDPLRRLRRRWKAFRSVNWTKTYYFNYRMFPRDIARKLPVFFYGKIHFDSLSGTIKIDAPIKRAMIGYGQTFEKTTPSKGIAKLSLEGDLVFKGHAHFGHDVFLSVSKGAYCEFGFMGCLGSETRLICTKEVIIGSWTGIGYQSQLIDTNSHPMMNTLTSTHYPMQGPIKIGNYNAISNRVSIMPKTITPDHCVVASNSVCNKDYTSLGTHILLGGVPAKLVRNNFARDWELEKDALMKSKRVYLD